MNGSLRQHTHHRGFTLGKRPFVFFTKKATTNESAIAVFKFQLPAQKSRTPSTAVLCEATADSLVEQAPKHADKCDFNLRNVELNTENMWQVLC